MKGEDEEIAGGSRGTSIKVIKKMKTFVFGK